MADDDFDRPHYHVFVEHITANDDNHLEPYIDLDDPCPDHGCPRLDQYFVVALDDYRKLVAAARDRHPTNQRGGATDPTGRPDSGPGVHDNCPVCSRPS